MRTRRSEWGEAVEELRLRGQPLPLHLARIDIGFCLRFLRRRVSRRWLAERWNWTDAKVRRLLDEEGLIHTRDGWSRIHPLPVHTPSVEN